MVQRLVASAVNRRLGTARDVNSHGEYVEKLVEALDHPEPGTRVHAAWILGELRARVAVDALVKVIETCRDDPELLAVAVESLGKIGSDAAVGPLVRLSEQSPLKARLAAVHVLGRWVDRQEVRDALGRALHDRTALVRAAAAEALAPWQQAAQ
jgi:HEAT repeat protein